MPPFIFGAGSEVFNWKCINRKLETIEVFSDSENTSKTWTP